MVTKDIPFATICHLFQSVTRRCFQSIQNDPTHETVQFLRALGLPEWLTSQGNKPLSQIVDLHKSDLQSLFCSEFALTIWQLSLALDQEKSRLKCMTLIPRYCHPSNVMELPQRFPGCWMHLWVKQKADLVGKFRG